jgi:Gram-negative bacterial TonB protein C-terminal
MRLRLTALWLAAAVLFASPLLAADDAQPLLDRLKSAADLTALDGSGLRPWHWKLDVTVFDKDGKNPKAGSLEIWFSGGNLRTVASLGSKQITSLRIGSNLYRTSGDEKDLAAVRLIEMQVLHPIPDEVIQPSTAVKLVEESVAAIKLDCMVPTVAQQSSDAIPGVQPISFCFEQGTAKMLVTYGPGGFSVLRPRVGMFQSHQVPVDLQTFSGTVMVSEAKTTKLATEPIDPSLFQIQPDMGPVDAPVVLPASDLRGLVLSKNPPVYPPEAKQRHAGGNVIFDATIGKDGHVLSLRPMAQSNALLIGSAKDAVSHWIFRPYLINGIPVEVKTQLTVVYAFGGPSPGAAGDAASDDQDAIKSSRR